MPTSKKSPDYGDIPYGKKLKKRLKFDDEEILTICSDIEGGINNNYLCTYDLLVGFGRACAPVRARPCAARTRLLGLINTTNGALRAPPPIAASLLP